TGSWRTGSWRTGSWRTGAWGTGAPATFPRGRVGRPGGRPRARRARAGRPRTRAPGPARRSSERPREGVGAPPPAEARRTGGRHRVGRYRVVEAEKVVALRVRVEAEIVLRAIHKYLASRPIRTNRFSVTSPTPGSITKTNCTTTICTKSMRTIPTTIWTTTDR